jgi:hypothetical protein
VHKKYNKGKGKYNYKTAARSPQPKHKQKPIEIEEKIQKHSKAPNKPKQKPATNVKARGTATPNISCSKTERIRAATERKDPKTCRTRHRTPTAKEKHLISSYNHPDSNTIHKEDTDLWRHF